MFFKANIPQLERMAKNFYEITNTLITVYDDQQNVICAYPEHLSGFCAEVRREPTLLKKCRQCDQSAFAMCSKTRRTYIYRCHMGLIEVATPILCNNLIIGYLLFGQIVPERDLNKLQEFCRQIAPKYRLDDQVLLAEIPKLKYRTTDYINAISSLLEMCANHIWLNSIISVHNEGLACSIEAYIQQNLHDDLQIRSICQTFNISRGMLYQLAKKNFGCGITEYVSLCRLNTAKKLLKRSDLHISEVAEQVGFADVNYFIRFFKKSTGLTPKKYRSAPDT